MNISDVVLSCRVRLARNIDGYPFPKKLTNAQIEDITEKAVSASKGCGELKHIKINQLQPLDRQSFVEKHLVSRELISVENASFLVNSEETLCIMICEEDHIRIQSILPSLDLHSADKLSCDADKIFSESLKYSWSPKLGYLTACPTNLGTGMRVSAMLHLTGLMLAKQTDSLFREIQKLGVAVRGFYGEGSAALGGIYQLSNQFTLGTGEDDIILSLDGMLRRIADQEMSIRDIIYRKNKSLIIDTVGRSLGICKYAERISYNEFMQHISNIKLGVSLGIISGVNMQAVDGLLIQCQPASLSLLTFDTLSASPLDKFEEDIARAKYLQNNLFKMERNV